MNLTEQVAHLDALLLGAVTTEFPDALTDAEKAAVNSYLVLCHACVEEFLEDVFVAHFDRLTEYLSWPLVPREAAGLLLAVGVLLPEKKRAPYGTRTLAGVAKAYAAEYRALVASNNGIKPDNLKKLAQGAGLVWSDFEGELASELADLDTLGAMRGEAGHLSPFSGKAVALTRAVYPDEVRDWVTAGAESGLAVMRYLRECVDDQHRCLAATPWG